MTKNMCLIKPKNMQSIGGGVCVWGGGGGGGGYKLDLLRGIMHANPQGHLRIMHQREGRGWNRGFVVKACLSISLK